MTNGTVVILGSTGRNFGAGMSGGEAFVLDMEDHFLDRYNPGMIDPVHVLKGSPEEARLRALIETHVAETGSPYGHHVLDHWASALDHFWYIKPNTTPAKKNSQALMHVPKWASRIKKSA
jgi:glutamate synthase (NADPH/NADH) large chain